MGPFCPPRFGLGTHQTLAEGQNSIFWWFGNEDMADGTNPGICLFENMTEDQMHAQHFKFLANYSLFTLSAWHDRLRALWPEVRDSMFEKRRRPLPDGQGVFWTGGPRDVLWAYKGFRFAPPAGKPVEQIYPVRRRMGAGPFNAEPLSVYVMR